MVLVLAVSAGGSDRERLFCVLNGQDALFSVLLFFSFNLVMQH